VAALGLVTMVAPLASFGVGGFWLKVFGQEGWQALRWLQGSFKYTALSTFLVLFALLLWAVFGPHDETTLNLLMVLSTFLFGQVVIELVSAKLQLEERYLLLAIWQFLPHLLRFLLVALLFSVLAELMTLQNLSFVYALTSLSVFAFGLFFLGRMYCGRLDLKGHGEPKTRSLQPVFPSSVKQVAAQSWPFGLAGIFYLIYFQSDIILLKYIAGDEPAGIYNVAFVIMTAVYLLPSVIYQKFLLPKIHRWAHSDRDRFYRAYRVGTWLMLKLGLIAMLAIWLLAPWGVQIFFGDSYMGAVVPLSILALAAPIRFVATSVGATLVTQEHMRRKVWLMAATAFFNIALNIGLIPHHGVAGAAIATVVSDACLLFLYLYSAKYYVFSKREVAC